MDVHHYPHRKKRVLGSKTTSKPPKADFEDAALGFLYHLTEERKNQTPGDPQHNYARTVADRLNQIKSVKRRTMVKHKIDSIIHDALMEEIPDE